MRALWQSRWFKGLLAVLLAVVLCLAPMNDAWARSGGRVGGGSFRAPRSLPRQSAPRSAPVYPGGGFGFPFLLPFFWGGGGGFLTLFLVLGVGSFLLRNLQASRESSGGYDDRGFYQQSNQKVQLTEIKLGLLASARGLQREIDALAMEADTNSPEGLRELLQNLTLTLTRHQDYWVYGQVDTRSTALSEAEQAFYQLSLKERSKFSAETLSNVGQKRIQTSDTQTSSETDALHDLGEYIVVTLLVASYRDSSTLPVANSVSALRQGLMQLGSIAADQIVAVEVLWTPQQEGDVLSADDLLIEYPQLRRL